MVVVFRASLQRLNSSINEPPFGKLNDTPVGFPTIVILSTLRVPRLAYFPFLLCNEDLRACVATKIDASMPSCAAAIEQDPYFAKKLGFIALLCLKSRLIALLSTVNGCRVVPCSKKFCGP